MIHVTDLDDGIVSDIRAAEEDVPLIKDGTLTHAGEYYLLTEYGFDKIEKKE